jgi:hypothetical protein
VATEQPDYKVFWPEGRIGNWRENEFVTDLLQNYGIFTKEEIKG